MTIPVWFTPSRLGTFDIACSQLCGLGHYRMRGIITVLDPPDFDRWLAAQR
jgi:cytochrome c oxidase subunit 2